MQLSQYHLRCLLSGFVFKMLYWISPSEACFGWASYRKGMKNPRVVGSGSWECRKQPATEG
jgi:hypothetical protein